ncbi:hypothetical protein VKT23_014625 [Stygiomarasmius scandens]|uniref:Uncharacterized protein n=1 Tax=Marasmiellus scandens TaxID=2682957 RepID=A0ABR1J4F9_9AGAR
MGDNADNTETASQEFNPDQQFDLEPLRPLTDNLDIFQIPDNKHPMPIYQYFLLPTLIAFHRMGTNEVIHQRRKTALQYAVQGLRMPQLLKYHTAPGRLYKHVFEAYLDALGTLLGTVKAVDPNPEKKEDGRRMYSLSFSRFEAFSLELRELLRSIEDSLRIKGRRVPTAPFWPEGSVGIDYFTQNDFEILCLAYRVQAENFLYQIDQVHDFAKGNIRTGQSEQRPISPVRGQDEPDSMSNFLRNARTNTHQFSSREFKD